MANTYYENFFLSNEVEDQFNSHLDLQPFCTVDTTLEGVAGMKRKINVYNATNGTQKLTKGQGNNKSIEVAYTQKEYDIALAQNRFEYYDEEEMTDANLVPVGMKHAGTDLFNTVNGDIYAEFLKTSLSVSASALNFDAFVDATAKLNIEGIENAQLFAFVCPEDVASLRKNLKDSLQYVEAFVRQGYIGTVAGINVYQKKDATKGTVVVATREAVTIFSKKGVEVENYDRRNRCSEDANIRKNTVYTRKYYIVALTDESKAVKITVA